MNTDSNGAYLVGRKKRHLKKSLIGLSAAITLIFLCRVAAQQKKPEVPFVPTPDRVVSEMLKIAHVDKDDVLYDLGCGDGRIVIMAAKMFGCQGVGIDIDPERIRQSQENAIEAGVSDRVQFIQMDLFKAEISEATVVTLYLLSKVNLRLRPKLLRELRPGTRVVSHDFDMEKWEPDATSSVGIEDYWDWPPEDYWDLHPEDYWDSHRVYLWIIPGNVTGTWKLTIPDITGKNKFSLKLNQKFQRIRGEAFDDIKSTPVFIRDEKIKGNELQFTLERKLKGRTERMHFEGITRVHIMEGYVRIEGRPGVKEKWKAKRIPSTLRSIESSNAEYFETKLPEKYIRNPYTSESRQP